MNNPAIREASGARLPVADLVAGLSIAGLLLPEAVAYSSIANLPPQAGVIGLFAGLVCYAIAGSSRYAIVAATSSSAAVMSAAIGPLVGDDSARVMLASGLVLLCGMFFVLAGIARLGSVSSFIARPVLRGFAFGLALVISLKQLPKMVAVHPGSGDILPYAWQLFSRAGDWNLRGLALGAAALLLLKLLAPLRRLPEALVVIALGIGAGRVLPLHAWGIELVGSMQLAIGWPQVPQLARADWLRLGELGFALVLVLFAESYGSIRTLALKHGDRIDPNRDLLALGLSNIAAGLFHGLPVGAGYSASSANEAAGATSRISGAFAAFVVLVLVAFALHWIELTPEPVLAAIVIHAVGHSLDPAAFKTYFAWRRDRIISVAAVVAVIVLGVLDGLLAAIGVSLLMMLRDLSEPRVSILGRLGSGHDFVNLQLHPEARAVDGVFIARPEAPMFFANAEQLLAVVRHAIPVQPAPRAVVLSLEESPDLDATSVEALREFAESLLRRGLLLRLARVKEPAQAVLSRAAIAQLPASSCLSGSVDDAVASALLATQAGGAVDADPGGG